MLINLWSTPRTGSVWYSIKLLKELKSECPEAQLLTEFFNRYHLNMYKKTISGITQNIHEYEEGCFYENFELSPEGEIKRNFVYSSRLRSIDEEESYRMGIVKLADYKKFPIIMHNHVMPLNPEIYRYLHSTAHRNIFISRQNLIEQLSSYAIACHTKVFAEFGEARSTNVTNVTVEDKVLEQLLERILHWESLDKSGSEIVCYENLNFNISNADKAKFTVKQNLSPAFDKLSEPTQNKILKLKAYYDQIH